MESQIYCMSIFSSYDFPSSLLHIDFISETRLLLLFSSQILRGFSSIHFSFILSEMPDFLLLLQIHEETDFFIFAFISHSSSSLRTRDTLRFDIDRVAFDFPLRLSSSLAFVTSTSHRHASISYITYIIEMIWFRFLDFFAAVWRHIEDFHILLRHWFSSLIFCLHSSLLAALLRLLLFARWHFRRQTFRFLFFLIFRH